MGDDSTCVVFTIHPIYFLKIAFESESQSLPKKVLNISQLV